jgi:hypothetical protein
MMKNFFVRNLKGGDGVVPGTMSRMRKGRILPLFRGLSLLTRLIVFSVELLGKIGFIFSLYVINRPYFTEIINIWIAEAESYESHVQPTHQLKVSFRCFCSTSFSLSSTLETPEPSNHFSKPRRSFCEV